MLEVSHEWDDHEEAVRVETSLALAALNTKLKTVYIYFLASVIVKVSVYRFPLPTGFKVHNFV
jgi:hypothetical protein